MKPISLHYKQIGQGQPIVILHGLFGSLDNWQTIAKELSEYGYRVITVDLRNHGRSPHTADMNHQLMAKDVNTLAEQLLLHDAILMGHSMGGKTAMEVVQSANWVQKLIVVDIAPKPYIAHHHTYFEAMKSIDFSTITSRKQAKELLSTMIHNESIVQFLAKNIMKDGSSYQWKFNLNSLDTNYEKLIGGITTKPCDLPMLFIAGKNSQYISSADHLLIGNQFKHAKIETIEDAGHWVHAEQPKAFVRSVLSFIEQ